MKLRLFSLFCIFMAVFLLGLFAVSAQDSTPAPTQPPNAPIDVLPVDQAASQLLMVVVGIIGSVVNAPVTTFISGLLKKIPLFNAIPARMVAFVVAGVLVVMTWIATYFGFSVQLNSLLNAVVVGGPVIMQFVITLMGSHAVYSYAAPRNLPVIGYQRPKMLSGYKSINKGQGLVEYALILVLVAVVVIVALALLGPQIGNIFSNLVQNLQCGGVACPQ